MDFDKNGNSNGIETPFVITPEALSEYQKKTAEQYLQLVAGRGVPVGAAQGREEWDVRPLFLESGLVKILRVSNPQKKVPQDLVSGLKKAYHLYSSHQSPSTNEFGMIEDSYIWQVRPFYQQTLADISSFQKVTLGIHPEELAQKLFYNVSLLIRNDVFHGHISFSNIAVDAGSCNLFDFCFAILNGNDTADLAPELLNDNSLTAAVDIYGLGIVFKDLLTHSLNPEQKEMVQCMCDENPKRRPDLGLIEKVLFNASHTDSYPLSSNILNSAEIKLGRVLGDNVVVVSDSDSLTKDGSLDEADSFTSGKSATVQVDSDREETVFQNITDSEQNRDTQSAIENNTQKENKSGNGYLVLLLLVVFVGGFLFFSRRSEPVEQPKTELTKAQYEEFWQMNIPSQMSYTADAAADGVVPAQIVIVKDVMNGVQRAGVSNDLLKKVFDPRWEAQLTDMDRLAAFQLALDKSILKKEHEMPPLKKLHPGVLYAIISVLDVSHDYAELNGISVSKLYDLPAPLGANFKALNPNLSLGDLLVRALAKILEGNRSPDVLAVFFGTCKSTKILIERIKFIRSDHSADDKIIWEVLKRSNSVAYPLIAWFEADTGANWGGEDASGKLDIITSEFLKNGTLKLEDYADLLTFPIMEVRAIAAAKILDKFVSKNNQPTLELMAEGKMTLTRKQVISFISILSMNSRLQYRLFEEWFETKPSAVDVVALLVSRKNMPDDMFNVVAIRYLKDKTLRISNDMLEQLVTHRESLVRVWAYTYLKPSDPVQLKILIRAYRNEKEERLKAQLRAKMADYRFLGQ